MIFIIGFKMMLTETPNITFSEILQDCVEMSNYTINIVQYTDYSITGDWGIIDGIRIFINSVIAILNIGVWLAQSLINLLIVSFGILRTFILT